MADEALRDVILRNLNTVANARPEWVPTSQLVAALRAVVEMHRDEEVETACDSRDCCSGPHEVIICAGCNEVTGGEECSTVRSIGIALGFGGW